MSYDSERIAGETTLRNRIMENQSQSPDNKKLKIARLFTSCCGLGFLPIAPGTWGSLPPAIIFAIMCWLSVPAIYIFVVMLIVAIKGSAFCVIYAPAVIEGTGKKDPGEVVADELAGQAVAFMAAPLLAPTAISPILGLIGFLAFRVFDILKPWPCKRLERLPHGVGILADDLMAGVYAAIALQIYIYFFGG